MTFIAGKYSMTYNALSAGQTREGIRLSHQIFKRLITGDSFGEGKQDAINRGVDAFLAADLIEANAAAAMAMIWPLGTFLDAGVIGRTDVGQGIAKQVILTALTGTPAQVAGFPATMTLPYCALLENFPVEQLFGPDLREFPWRGRIYPNSSGIFGTQT